MERFQKKEFMKRFAPLDVFRMLAALAMIGNHAVVTWLNKADQPFDCFADAVLNVGSFAPALFFFATGLGYGWQLRQTGGFHTGRFFDIARKACLIWCADIFLWIGPECRYGMSFLGFISVSMLTIALCCLTRRARISSVAVILAVILGRFIVVPQFSDAAERWPAILQWLCGRPPIAGVGYPFSPWIVLPLSGFLLGYDWPGVVRNRRVLANNVFVRTAVVAGVGCFCLLISRWMISRGMPFHRWASVSAAFLVAAVGTVLVAFALSVLLALSPDKVRRCLQLDGLASFAVVPIHYVILDAVGAVVDQPRNCLFAFAILLAMVLTVLAAESLSAGLGRLARMRLPFLSTASIVCGIAAGIALAVCSLSGWLRHGVAAIGQLSLLVLLVERRVQSGRAKGG
jgi:hypothetical protein